MWCLHRSEFLLSHDVQMFFSSCIVTLAITIVAFELSFIVVFVPRTLALDFFSKTSYNVMHCANTPLFDF